MGDTILEGLDAFSDGLTFVNTKENPEKGAYFFNDSEGDFSVFDGQEWVQVSTVTEITSVQDDVHTYTEDTVQESLEKCLPDELTLWVTSEDLIL